MHCLRLNFSCGGRYYHESLPARSSVLKAVAVKLTSDRLWLVVALGQTKKENLNKAIKRWAMRSVATTRLRVGFDAQRVMSTCESDLPATEAVKKNVRLESALVRHARNQFTWGEMGRLRIVEW